MDDFEALLRQFEERIEAAAVKRVQETADQWLADSRAVVPYQEGDLSRSGHVQVRGTGTGAEGQVAYDIVYARYQELREDLRHQDTGQAHYLGGTGRKNASRYLDHLSGVWKDLG